MLAEQDTRLLAQRELRPVRLQLELLKPEMALEQHGIESTIVVFGSTRIVEREAAEQRLDQARRARGRRPERRRAERVAAQRRAVAGQKPLLRRRPASSPGWSPTGARSTARGNT